MEAASIDEAKDHLYGQPVESFVAERDVLVKAIRSSGDRALANEVKTLRKPSAVAAVVNRVVRADPDGVELILQAAALLRAAQTGALDGTTINASELQQQYRAAIQALAQTAPDRRAEVRAALEAATIDEASNEDLRTGCLVAVPTPVSIFGTAPTSATPTPKPKPKPAAEPAAEVVAEPPVDELEARRERRRAANEKAIAKKANAKKLAAEQLAAKKLAAEHAAAEKAAAAEAERKRKAAEKERQKELKKQRKDLQKQHREAVRAHLKALDAHADASAAIDEAEQDLVDTDDEIAAAEHALAQLQARRQDRIVDRDRNEQSKLTAHEQAEEAEAAVAALAAALDEIEASIS